MKAVVIHATGGPEQLTVADMPDPVPGPGEVLLDVAYAGCNWADTQVRMGIYPHAMTYPMVLGFEVSGTVAALGSGVSGVKVGDKVASFPEKGGAYAEKCVAPAVGLIKLPDGVGLDVGAAFPIQALTAYTCCGRSTGLSAATPCWSMRSVAASDSPAPSSRSMPARG